MKTIEEEAELWAKYQKEIRLLGQRVSTCRSTEDFQIDAFIAGAEFAEQWISVDDELPPEEKKCPRASIDCLVIDSSGRVFIAIYAFFLKEWWSNETQEQILNIVKWRPITRL